MLDKSDFLNTELKLRVSKVKVFHIKFKGDIYCEL